MGPSVAEAAETIHDLFASILGGAPTRVSVVDGDRLSPVASSSPVSFELSDASDQHRESVPLLSHGALTGLVEVIAPAEVVSEARAVLDAAARQGAALLAGLIGRAPFPGGSARPSEVGGRSTPAGADEMVHLFESLLQSTTTEDAIRTLTGFCSVHHGQPIAVWLRREDGRHVDLVSCRGLGTKGYHKLRACMRTIRRHEAFDDDERRLASRFQSITSARAARILDSGRILVMWGEAGVEGDARIAALARYVGGLVSQLSAARRGELCRERMDEGLALTAHEMKSPIVGAMAAIDFALAADQLDDRRRYLLGASRQELGKLSELIDSLLSSTDGSDDDDIVETNLADLVRQAAESCSWESGEGRIMVDAPPDVPVRGEISQLRAAVKNMIRTALTYTPGGAKVSVRVREEDGLATVSVRDHGPCASGDELSAIFDPALRSEKTGSRAGRTLGLVVTKRVALALGGRVWAQPCRDGANVHFQLPSLSV